MLLEFSPNIPYFTMKQVPTQDFLCVLGFVCYNSTVCIIVYTCDNLELE